MVHAVAGARPVVLRLMSAQARLSQDARHLRRQRGLRLWTLRSGQTRGERHILRPHRQLFFKNPRRPVTSTFWARRFASRPLQSRARQYVDRRYRARSTSGSDPSASTTRWPSELLRARRVMRNFVDVSSLNGVMGHYGVELQAARTDPVKNESHRRTSPARSGVFSGRAAIRWPTN